MRIGLEMFGTQTESRHRGIGRYCRNLAAAMLARGPATGCEFVLYAAEALPTDLVPSGPGAALRLVAVDAQSPRRPRAGRPRQPRRLDALLVLNPIDLYPGCDLPARPARGGVPRLAAVAYDLIPLLFPDGYLRDWPGTLLARRYVVGLDRLRGYDRVLAISEATRDDVIRCLGMSTGRVVAIGGAGDDHAGAFVPEADGDDDRLRALGLADAPFVFSVAATDPRKNLDGVLAAFTCLPADLRAAYRLAVTVRLAPEQEAALRRRADDLGIGASLVLTGPVNDAVLAALYRRAAAFVFPSLYEGFGLPILEALACGAAVVAGDNSSQPEVAGDAAILVDARDPAAVADGLARLLTDHALAADLRRRGPTQARMFSWDAVAARALDALRFPMDEAVARPRRRRIALVAPLPPDPSETARAAEALAASLARRDAVDVFHAPRACPTLRFQMRGVGFHDYRVFSRFDRVRPYDAVVYVMGPAPEHAFVAEVEATRPGLIVRPDEPRPSRKRGLA